MKHSVPTAATHKQPCGQTFGDAKTISIAPNSEITHHNISAIQFNSIIQSEHNVLEYLCKMITPIFCTEYKMCVIKSAYIFLYFDIIAPFILSELSTVCAQSTLFACIIVKHDRA